jgi:Fe-S cluster biogenesis protein NfuA
VPPALAGLLADGTLTEVRLETAAVVTVLGAGRDGARVRSPVHAALADTAGWSPPAITGDCEDEPLRRAAHGLLDGPVGDLARSHGGHIELADVSAGVVRVRLHGACYGCPAARLTLRHRLEQQLRRQYPDVREVVEAWPPRVLRPERLG